MLCALSDTGGLAASYGMIAEISCDIEVCETLAVTAYGIRPVELTAICVPPSKNISGTIKQ